MNAPAGKRERERRVGHQALGGRRDSKDFRDLVYHPTLAPLETSLFPEWDALTVLDQQSEGACTGFALAAVINYLNRRGGDATRVSARMLYEMAKRYDRWPGVGYEGSSARGAMKGWYKHGVAPEDEWPYDPGDPGALTKARALAALRYPLGSYFRVLPRRNDVQAALNEVGVVLASAGVHAGWDKAFGRPRVPSETMDRALEGHAFALVGYTDEGFLVLNSWGRRWGGFRDGRRRRAGVALWAYADFELNVWDLWVARPALPVRDSAASLSRYAIGTAGARRVNACPPQAAIYDDYVHIDDGQFDPRGEYPSLAEEVERIVAEAVAGDAGGAAPKHLVLYAHGGLNPVEQAAMRAYRWRHVFPANDARCLHFIWETGLFEELKDILFGKDVLAEGRVGAFSDWWDTFVEQAVQPAGYRVWKEMKDDTARAFAPGAAGRLTLEWLKEALEALPPAKRPALHLVGHSAGSIWHAELVRAWEALEGPPIRSLILFAPACTHALFESHLLPAIRSQRIEAFHHFLLDDRRERDDHVARIYRKSLLYLVSNALEDKDREAPVLGMERSLSALPRLPSDRAHTYVAGRDEDRTRAASHGGFDNDATTMDAMLALMRGRTRPKRKFLPSELEGY